MSEQRDPDDAIEEIGEKLDEGDEPSREEREFLESEHVDPRPGDEDVLGRDDPTR